MTWILIGCALGLALPYLLTLVRRRRDLARAGVRGAAAAGAAGRGCARPANPFAAVSVRAEPWAPCEAVGRLDGKRFLALRAPSLPVAGCHRQTCGCRYVRHSDRREPGDRRDAYASYGGISPQVKSNRRLRRERRTTG